MCVRNVLYPNADFTYDKRCLHFHNSPIYSKLIHDVCPATGEIRLELAPDEQVFH